MKEIPVARVLFVIAALAFGYHGLGWWGVYSMIIALGVIGAWLGPPVPKVRVLPSELPDDVREVPARRGNPDPTRPTQDDYAAMLTNLGRRIG